MLLENDSPGLGLLAVCHVRGLTSLCKGLQYSQAEVSEPEPSAVCVALGSDGSRILLSCDILDRCERNM